MLDNGSSYLRVEETEEQKYVCNFLAFFFNLTQKLKLCIIDTLLI